MKLRELDKLRQEVSGTASAQVRTLALGGLAVVWLFAAPFFQGIQGARTPSWILSTAGGFFAVSLVLDVIQLYVRSSIVQYRYWRAESDLEKVATDETVMDDCEVEDVGSALTWATAILFYAKGVAVGLGFAYLLFYFVSELSAAATPK